MTVLPLFKNSFEGLVSGLFWIVGTLGNICLYIVFNFLIQVKLNLQMFTM